MEYFERRNKYVISWLRNTACQRLNILSVSLYPLPAATLCYQTTVSGKWTAILFTANKSCAHYAAALFMRRLNYEIRIFMGVLCAAVRIHYQLKHQRKWKRKCGENIEALITVKNGWNSLQRKFCHVTSLKTFTEEFGKKHKIRIVWLQIRIYSYIWRSSP